MSQKVLKKLRVGLVQINNSFSGQQYLPYSTACLRSYVKKFATVPDRYEFLSDVYKRLPVSKIIDHTRSASILGFSTYVWNIELSREVAKRAKTEDPTKIIIFGGPQVPDNSEKFLRENPFIDFVVHNEGEATFLEYLEGYPYLELQKIKGISFINKAGYYEKTESRARIRDFSQVPSPFLTGGFDSLIAENPDEKWIGLWETNRGCPFQCTFCDWGSATAAKVSKFEMDRLSHEMDWFAERRIEYIFVCDANFGIQKRDVEIARYISNLRSRTGFPCGFSVQNTKNSTERAYLTQKILSDAGLNKGVALSMQSLSPVALENIKRDNISLDSYLELSTRFTADGVETYSDLILGLPGETFSSYLDGIDKLIRAGQHNRIQFNNLSILPNAEMGSPEYLKKFEIETVRSEIINIHGTKDVLDDDVPEMQDLVVSNYSMNRQDWKRARAISWLVALLYFDKIAQIPVMVAHYFAEISFTEIFEQFFSVTEDDYPTLSKINTFFLEEAEKIQNGGPEYCFSSDWLGIYWPADEYVFIKLTQEGRLPEFYAEVERKLVALLGGQSTEFNGRLIGDAVALNHKLLSQPSVSENTKFHCDFDIYKWWREALVGKVNQDLNPMAGPLEIQRSTQHFPEFQEWCRQVVWWGNKKGAYLYTVESDQDNEVSIELAGHF